MAYGDTGVRDEAAYKIAHAVEVFHTVAHKKHLSASRHLIKYGVAHRLFGEDLQKGWKPPADFPLEEGAKFTICHFDFAKPIGGLGADDPAVFDPRAYLTVARDEVRKMVKHKITEVLGSSGALDR